MGFPDLLAGADRSALRILGGSVSYAPEFGEPVEVAGIFDAAYVLANGGGGVAGAGVECSAPGVWVLLADLPIDPDDDNPTITYQGVTYTVRERRRDGTGGVVLMLRETE